MINGKTKQLGIIGYPAEHSFSPAMHNFIAAETGMNYVYSAWTVAPENLAAAIAGIRALGIRGINVTAPHKVEVMKYLDEVSGQAQRLGAVNTVVNRGGRLTGYNTDADGFCMAIKSRGVEFKDKNILVMGAGGVVKPTLTRVLEENPKSITVLNRTKARAEKLVGELKAENGADNLFADLRGLDFDMVINTTSAGMEPQENLLPTDLIEELDGLDFIGDKTVAVDMIYNPEKTRFLLESEKRGAKIINGLGMLIYQGIIAYELFTDTKLPEDMADRIRREVFGR